MIGQLTTLQVTSSCAAFGREILYIYNLLQTYNIKYIYLSTDLVGEPDYAYSGLNAVTEINDAHSPLYYMFEEDYFPISISIREREREREREKRKREREKEKQREGEREI